MASAGALDHERSRAPLPAREVERGDVLARGWTEVSTELTREAVDLRTAEGDADLWTDRWQVDLRHGWLPRVEAFLRLRTTRRQGVPALLDPQAGSLAHRSARVQVYGGFLDPAMGLRGALLKQDWPGTWVSWEAGYKAPYGPDGGEGASGGLAGLSTGTPDAWGALSARRRIGALRLGLTTGWVIRFPGLVSGLASEPDAVVRRDPGDGPQVGGDALLQAGPLFTEARIDWRHFGPEVQRVRPATGPVVRRVDKAAGSQLMWTVRAGTQLSRGLMASAVVQTPLDASGYTWPDGLLGPRIGGQLQVFF